MLNYSLEDFNRIATAKPMYHVRMALDSYYSLSILMRTILQELGRSNPTSHLATFIS